MAKLSVPVPGLRRELTLMQLVLANVGGIVGSSWLLGSMTSAQYAGPAAVLAWIAGGILTLFMALPFVELSSMIPESGALVRYPQYSHGSLVSFFAGWAIWLSYVVVPPIEAEATVQYANAYLPGLYSASGNLTGIGILLSMVLVVVFFIVNYLAVKVFARVNSVVTLFKFVVPTLTFLLLIILGFHGSNFTAPAHGGFIPFGAQGVMTAIAVGGVAFAYQGFRQAIDLAGESRNPERDVPRAVVYSLLIAIVLYTLLQVAFIGGLSGHDLAAGWAKINFSSPFANLAVALNLGWLAVLLYADAIISPSGTGLVYEASSARILYAMPKNGYGPPALLRVHAKFGVPSLALVVSLVVGALSLLPFPAWSKLVGIASTLAVISYILGPVSAMVLRRTGSTLARTVRLKRLPLWSLLGFLSGMLIIYWTGWPNDLYIGLGLIVGLLLYGYYYARNGLPKEDLRSGAWLLVLTAFIIAMSYVGSTEFGGTNIIPYPWDLAVLLVASVGFFYWAVASGHETTEVRQHSADQVGAGGAADTRF
jgi:amino acid transporter